MAPEDAASCLFNLGGTHETLGRHSEALHAYRQALEREKDVNEARIYNNIGNVLYKEGRKAEALHAYREAVDADADFPETHQNLAAIFGEEEAAGGLGRHDEAQHHWQEAIRLLSPQQGQQQQHGDADEALERLRRRRDEAAAAHESKLQARRQATRREEINQRDQHLSREERVARFQQVVGACGDDKGCMKRALGQEDAAEDDLVVF